MELAGILDGAGDFVTTHEHFPLLQELARCPHCGRDGTFYTVIALHLNDHHKWSIDQIAEWVATVEPPEAPEEITPMTSYEEACFVVANDNA